MKITVKHKETEITVSDHENLSSDNMATMRWDDQNKQIQETIVVMTEQVKKLI